MNGELYLHYDREIKCETVSNSLLNGKHHVEEYQIQPSLRRHVSNAAEMGQIDLLQGNWNRISGGGNPSNILTKGKLMQNH